MVDLYRVINSAVKNGKVLFGSKQTMVMAKSGRAVALVVASNCPPRILVDLKRYSQLSNIPLFVYPASSMDLGSVCGKSFAVSALTIRETSDPDILKMKALLNRS